MQQYGQKIFRPLLQLPNVYYIDVDSEHEFDHWAAQLNPDIVVYNYYSGATMPWLTPGKIAARRPRFKQACIFHELPLDSMGFDRIIHQDPNEPGGIPRPIPSYPLSTVLDDMPTFGSFGFGLGGKGFRRVVEIVAQHYDRARVRLNIPFAHFGDANGAGARSYFADCHAAAGPNIQLVITHILMEEPELVRWLSEHTANCFFYDENYGRGLTGTLDYALAARRPIAITKSWQFKHMWKPELLVEETPLPTIVSNGIAPLKPFYAAWGDTALRAAFMTIFQEMLS